MCLDRLGKLEIPNGIAGAAGPAGANGAGWASGGGNPVGAPAADILFWLNTTSGELFKYVSGSWVSQVASIFGTDGNLWLTGAVAPTAPTAEGNFYYNTATGDIYQYLSGSWGGVISNIKGANGTNGVNGTGLLGSSVNVAGQVFTVSTSPFNLNSTVTFNGQQAFPTVGSVVRSTFFVKARFNNTSSTNKAPSNQAEIYYIPRVVNVNTSGSFDPNTPSIEQNATIDSKILYGPSAINNNYTHGVNANDTDPASSSQTGLPAAGTSPSKAFPYAYTKIVTTLIRVGATTITGSVEYTTTTRYGTYTANYDPIFSSFALNFSSSGGISVEQIGSVTVPVGYPISIEPVYHIVEKSIL